MIDLFGETEKPFTGESFTGPTTGLAEAAGRGIMRGGVRVAEAAALTAAAIAPSESAEDFERKQGLDPEERGNILPSKEDFFRFIDERLTPAADYWSPDPATLTSSGQVVSALFELPLQLAAGPAGLVATPSLSLGRELVDEGVDPGTATAASVMTAGAMGAAISLPVAGQSLKQTLGLIAANPAIGAAQDLATQELLEFRGYEEQAQMFDPFNPAARSVDLVLGALFGGLHEYARARKTMPQEAVDAIDAVNLTKQREALSPFVAAHNRQSRAAFEEAISAITEGRAVNVGKALEPLIPKKPEPSYTADRFRAESKDAFGLTDEQADAALALVAARAKVAGEDLDAWISRNIAEVRQGEAPAEALAQDRPIVQPFYSKVLAEVENLQQEKWTGEQLLGKLRKTPGVKVEELAWTGLDEFLDRKKSVTREEVREFLDRNQVRIEEVVKGGQGFKSLADLNAFRAEMKNTYGTEYSYEWPEEAQRELSRLQKLADNPPEVTKYQQYTLPGGENYREMLLTLSGGWSEADHAEYSRLVAEKVTRQSVAREDLSPEKQARLEALAAKKDESFRSGHYDEKNILAHVRFNERTGPNGERILHLEEVQSDWHQQGRSKGYRKEGGPIPDAPFKKTWHELALRRMLRHAAENGFDRLTWTGGELQAARYDLSKQLDSLSYEAQGDRYRITGRPKGGAAQEFGTFSEAQLEDAIGKEMAEKIRARRAEGQESGEFTGDGLKIGGEGMRGFYDKILPAYLNKFGKKFGGKVEPVEIPTGHASRVTSHGIKITDAMRDSLLYEGTPLFQGEKGAVSFLADGRAVIHALEAPDFSTLLHEIGHIFRRDLPKRELAELETWLLSKVPGGKWEVADEEKFARAFERYLAEGKAPSAELQGVFDKFKNWLLEIYQRITGTAIDVKLAPQVRAVFDRMLFTREMKTVQPPDVVRARAAVAAEGAEMLDDLHRDLGLDPEGAAGPALPSPSFEIPTGPDAAAGFLRSPENVSRVLAEMFEAEATALENSRAEQMAADGQALNAMVSDAAEWFLQKNRDMKQGGSAMDKKSVVNALRKAAAGDFARLTPGQQEMVLSALDSLSRQAQALVKEIDAQDLRVGDRFATPDLGQRVVVGEREGALYLDNGQALDLSETVQVLGEIDRRGRPENMPESAAEYYLQERGDFELYDGADSEGNPKMRSAREMINEARADLAKAEAQEHLYKRAAFCLNLG